MTADLDVRRTPFRRSPIAATGSHDPFLHEFHLPALRERFVIEPREMKQPVDDVETQLVLERSAELPRLSFRRFRADENLTVLKGDHVGRSRLIHKLLMNFRDAFVRNENDADLGKEREWSRFSQL